MSALGKLVKLALDTIQVNSNAPNGAEYYQKVIICDAKLENILNKVMDISSEINYSERGRLIDDLGIAIIEASDAKHI